MYAGDRLPLVSKKLLLFARQQRMNPLPAMDIYDNFPAIFSPKIFSLVKTSHPSQAFAPPVRHLCTACVPPACMPPACHLCTVCTLSARCALPTRLPCAYHLVHERRHWNSSARIGACTSPVHRTGGEYAACMWCAGDV